MRRCIVKNQMAMTGVILLGMIANCAWADWTIDFSRRTNSGSTSGSTSNSGSRSRLGSGVGAGSANLEVENSSAEPMVNQMENDRSIFSRIFSSSSSDELAQEIVIMQTESGFVPKRIQVRQGLTYKISVVNVNEKERNVSFVMDAFSEHHATYYGKIKSFVIHPQQDGVFSYQSPETAFQGQLVVVPSDLPNLSKSQSEEIRSKSESKIHTEEVPPPISTELRIPTSVPVPSSATPAPQE